MMTKAFIEWILSTETEKEAREKLTRWGIFKIEEDKNRGDNNG